MNDGEGQVFPPPYEEGMTKRLDKKYEMWYFILDT